MATIKRSLGGWFLHIALALIFLVDGIALVNAGAHGNMDTIIRFVLGLVEIVSGVILLLQLFVPIGGSANKLLMLIILIAVIVAIVLYDIIGDAGLFGGHVFNSTKNLLAFLKTFGTHLLMLGAVLIVRG